MGLAGGEEAKPPGHLPSSGRRLRAVGPKDGGRQEDHQLAAGLEVFTLLEEPAEYRDVAHQRHLANGLLLNVLRHATDDQSVTLSDEDLCLRLALVDDRDGRAREGDEITPRIV